MLTSPMLNIAQAMDQTPPTIRVRNITATMRVERTPSPSTRASMMKDKVPASPRLCRTCFSSSTDSGTLPVRRMVMPLSSVRPRSVAVSRITCNA